MGSEFEVTLVKVDDLLRTSLSAEPRPNVRVGTVLLPDDAESKIQGDGLIDSRDVSNEFLQSYKDQSTAEETVRL